MVIFGTIKGMKIFSQKIINPLILVGLALILLAPLVLTISLKSQTMLNGALRMRRLIIILARSWLRRGNYYTLSQQRS